MVCHGSFDADFSGAGDPFVVDRMFAENLLGWRCHQPGHVWFIHPAARYHRGNVTLPVRLVMNSHCSNEFNARIGGPLRRAFHIEWRVTPTWENAA
jgi:hypothetical protein